jgi:hypothetical protein
MKWEEGADLDDVDEDDRAAFEILRKACQPLIISYTWLSIKLIPEGTSFVHGLRTIH